MNREELALILHNEWYSEWPVVKLTDVRASDRWLAVADAAIAALGQQQQAKPTHVVIQGARVPLATLHYKPHSHKAEICWGETSNMESTAIYENIAARDAALAELDRATGCAPAPAEGGAE